MDNGRIIDEHFCFYGTGVTAYLRCDWQGCTLDVTIPGPLIDRCRPAARLEVLMQPLDRQRWLPRGYPVLLLKERLDLTYIRGCDQAFGRSWLPGIEPSSAAIYYYRVTPELN